MLIAGVDGDKNVRPILTDEYGHPLPIVTLTSLPAGANNIGTVISQKGDTSYTKIRKYVTLSLTTETAVWTPASGKKFVVTDIFIASSGAAGSTCTLRDGTAGTVFLIVPFAVNGWISHNMQTPVQSTTINNVLTAQMSAITGRILVTGYEV